MKDKGRDLILYRLTLLLKQFKLVKDQCFEYLDFNDIRRLNEMRVEVEAMKVRVHGST